MRGITARIAATILAILVMAGLLQTVLTISKFDGAFTNLLQSRLSVAVLDIRETVEGSLNLGLPLNALVNTQELLDKERGQDGYIQSILVHDRSGARLFDTERARVGQPVAAAWTQRSDAGRQVWVLRDGEGFVVGAPLVNSLGETAGGVVLRYDHIAYDAAFRAVLERLATTAAAVLAAAALLVSLIVVWLFRPLRHRLEELDAALRDEQGGAAAAVRHDDALLAGHLAPLHRALGDVQGRLAEAANLLAKARQEKMRDENPEAAP
ncbi:MAG: hypothetical protein ACK4NA_05480 [Alphaproteobacteria bacterium]